jgi:hypothetical protein
MKRIFTLLLVMFAVTVNAQSIRLFHNNNAVNDGDTVFVPLAAGYDEVSVYLGYENVTDDDVLFRVRKEVVTYSGDADDIYFCIGECYPGSLSSTLEILANETITADMENAFHATYAGNGQTAVVRFTFFVVNNESDKVSFYVCFGNGSGIQASDLVKCLHAYPNPAQSVVNIDYMAPNSNSFLVIKNLTGREVYRTEVSFAGKKQVDISKFSAGVYFYGVESEGKMLCTKKLLVR